MKGVHRNVNLGELVDEGLAELQTGPFGTSLHASSYVSEGIPVIAVKDIGENRLTHTEVVRVDEQTAQRLDKYRVRVNDIIFSRKGAVERRALIRQDEAGWIQGSDCIRLRLRDSIDAPFVSYWLGTPYINQWLKQHATGATMPSLNQAILRLLPIQLPPPAEQRAISRILGALDDKIALNRRLNQTLEALAATLFRAWFVDFEPVRAKREGRAPVGIDAATAALFPDRLVASALAEIPAGWELTTIGSAVQVVGGTTPSTTEPAYWSGAYAFATPKDMSKLDAPVLLTTERHITDAGLARISSGLLPSGSLLLSSRAPIGYLAVNDVPVSVNQGIIGIIPPEGVPVEYLLFWTKANMDQIVSRANGSTFLEVSKANFRTIPFLLPDLRILGAFKDVAAPLIDRIVLNLRQNRTLAELRDTLLPRLLSGELRVPEELLAE